MFRIKSFFWINGLFFILFGMLLFFQPSLSLRLIIIVTSIEILISGFIGLYVARVTTEYEHRKLLVTMSILTLIAGFLLLCFPGIGEIIASIAVVLFGIGAIIKGVFLIMDGIKVKEIGITNWWTLPAFGILSIIFGLFLITNAFLTVLVINVLLGFALIFLGIMLIIRGFQSDEKKLEGIEDIDGIEYDDDLDD